MNYTLLQGLLKMQRLQQHLHHLSSTRVQAFQHPLRVQVHERPSRPLHGHLVGAQGNHAYPYARNDDSSLQKERRDRGTRVVRTKPESQ